VGRRESCADETEEESVRLKEPGSTGRRLASERGRSHGHAFKVKSKNSGIKKKA